MFSPYISSYNADKAGLIPVVGTFVGAGRITIGTSRVIVNSIPALAGLIFKQRYNRHAEACRDGLGSVGRGILELMPFMGTYAVLTTFADTPKLYRIDKQRYKLRSMMPHPLNGAIYEGRVKFAKPKCKSGKIIMDDGSVYTGPVDSREENYLHVFYRQGWGEKTYIDGSVYYGYWRDDKRWGPGTMTYPDGSIAEGEWFSHVGENCTYYDGEVTINFKDGRIYEGFIRDVTQSQPSIFVFYGQGKLTLPTGEVFDGKWKNNRKNGDFIHTLPNGKRFKEYWINNELVREERIHRKKHKNHKK